MDLTALLTDDQIAVMGCFLALSTCGLVAAMSFRLGPAGKQQDSARTSSAGRIGPAANSNRTADGRASGNSIDRRAA